MDGALSKDNVYDTRQLYKRPLCLLLWTGPDDRQTKLALDIKLGFMYDVLVSSERS